MLLVGPTEHETEANRFMRWTCVGVELVPDAVEYFQKGTLLVAVVGDRLLVPAGEVVQSIYIGERE